MADLEPTEAQRLSRLRILLSTAAARLGDNSDAGLHVATVAIDGAGELAVGLCVHKLGLSTKQTDGVPQMLNRIQGKLRKPITGAQGYRELHRMRNLVQHEGVLPAADQLPRWLAETESMCAHLIEACFKVSLNETGSSDGVADPELRAQLKSAEIDLDKGAAQSSFESSWQALDLARRKLQSQTHTQPARPPMLGALGGSTRSVGELYDRVNAISEQLELYAFTADPGDWLWFRDRHMEAFNGPPPDLDDAARAFVFVLGWVLSFEAYLARHGPDRWERWRESQRSPQTGIPNGPHVRGVALGEKRVSRRTDEEDEIEWLLELTDVPEGTHPDFAWALNEVARRMAETGVARTAVLYGGGHMSVFAPDSASGAEIARWVRGLLPAAKAELEARLEADAAGAALAEQLAAPFREALERAGLGAEEVLARPPEGRSESPASEAEIWISLQRPADTHTSWFPKAAEECFGAHFPEAIPQTSAGAPYRAGFYDVTVPADWDPERVAAWIAEAVEADSDKRHNEVLVRNRQREDLDRRLQELRRDLVEGK